MASTPHLSGQAGKWYVRLNDVQSTPIGRVVRIERVVDGGPRRLERLWRAELRDTALIGAASDQYQPGALRPNRRAAITALIEWYERERPRR